MMGQESDTARHEHFMSLAIDEAMKGAGRTFPNPYVGCVIVHRGEVVAAGYHPKAGEAHAEVNAFKNLPAHIDRSECELYVTLEPCCVYGRTPPCTSKILDEGVRRVFIGALDPNPDVLGNGVKRLEEHGVTVTAGILRERCEELIEPFAKRMVTGMPLVVAKWAMSLDGKIATRTHDSSWITSEASRHIVHQLRDRYDAIAVGKNTAIHDDPRLTCRIDGGQDPWRVVFDARLEIPLDAKLFDPTSASAPTVVLVGADAPERSRTILEARGVRVVQVSTDDAGRLDLVESLKALGALGLTSLFVEGGAGVLGALLDARLIDKVHAFIAPKLIGGEGALSSFGGAGAESMRDVFALEGVRVEQVEGGDVYVTGRVPREHRAHPVVW